MKNLKCSIPSNALKRFLFEVVLIVLFFLFAFAGNAFSQSLRFKQNYHKDKIPQSVKVISVYAGSIILNAVGDGLNDSGKKGWGHLCNAASIGLLLTSPFIIDYDKSKWGYYLTSYVALRIAAFDYTYNTTRGLPLNYIGGTSTWDKSLKKLNPPNTYLGRTVFLTVGVFIPINELDRNHSRLSLHKNAR